MAHKFIDHALGHTYMVNRYHVIRKLQCLYIANYLTAFIASYNVYTYSYSIYIVHV